MEQRDTLPGRAGLEHLFDGLLQPVGVGQHGAVEVRALGLGDVARLERLQIEADGGDRRLQLVRDGIEERILLVVAMQLAHEEHGVHDDAGDDERKGHHAEHERQEAARIDVDPPDVEGEGRRHEDDAERHDDNRGGLSGHGVDCSEGGRTEEGGRR